MRIRLPSNPAAIVLLMFLVQGFGPLRAQTSFGFIVGTVTDASQAAVPDASISITNTQTCIARQAKTNQAGEYRVPSLLPGVCTVFTKPSETVASAFIRKGFQSGLGSQN